MSFSLNKYLFFSLKIKKGNFLFKGVLLPLTLKEVKWKKIQFVTSFVKFIAFSFYFFFKWSGSKSNPSLKLIIVFFFLNLMKLYSKANIFF